MHTLPLRFLLAGSLFLAAGCVDSRLVQGADTRHATSDAVSDSASLDTERADRPDTGFGPGPNNGEPRDSGPLDSTPPATDTFIPGDGAPVDASMDTSRDNGADADPPMDTMPPPRQPRSVTPCNAKSDCWQTSLAARRCFESKVREDYSTGRFNVHRWETTLFGNASHNRLALQRTGGNWTPAVVIIQTDGTVLFDGRIGRTSGPVHVRVTESRSDRMEFLVDAQTTTRVYVFATSETALQSGFQTRLPRDATYELKVESSCQNPPQTNLRLPPNFDPNARKNGYYQLPPSQPPGLYTRKHAECSWGQKNLIKVFYTVAAQWNQIRPAQTPLGIRDLNENVAVCGVDHVTHSDGTHGDLTHGCATQVSCGDDQPAIDLAKLLIDTGEVCGILYNDPRVQRSANQYFRSKHNFRPWGGTFMRSVTGHDHHFHIRVRKPNGACN